MDICCYHLEKMKTRSITVLIPAMRGIKLLSRDISTPYFVISPQEVPLLSSFSPVLPRRPFSLLDFRQYVLKVILKIHILTYFDISSTKLFVRSNYLENIT